MFGLPDDFKKMMEESRKQMEEIIGSIDQEADETAQAEQALDLFKGMLEAEGIDTEEFEAYARRAIDDAENGEPPQPIINNDTISMDRYTDILDSMGLSDEEKEQMIGLAKSVGTRFEEVDLNKLLADYSPAPRDDADRAFVEYIKEFIKVETEKVKEDTQNVTALAVFYHTYYTEEDEPRGDLHLMYTDTTDSVTMSYTANYNESSDCEEFDQDLLDEWFDARGFSFEETPEDVFEEYIFDMAVVAVSQLHEENFFEGMFGKKIPVIINSYEQYPGTAVRAAKANGKGAFDRAFYNECGIDKF